MRHLLYIDVTRHLVPHSTRALPGTLWIRHQMTANKTTVCFIADVYLSLTELFSSAYFFSRRTCINTTMYHDANDIVSRPLDCCACKILSCDECTKWTAAWMRSTISQYQASNPESVGIARFEPDAASAALDPSILLPLLSRMTAINLFRSAQFCRVDVQVCQSVHLFIPPTPSSLSVVRYFPTSSSS